MAKKKTSRYTLGINCSYGLEGMGHDPSAALLIDGEIVAMAAEERFVRIKKAPGKFPAAAINYCLEYAGISIEDIDSIGYYSDPDQAVEIWKGINRPFLRNMAYAFENIMDHLNLNITTSEVFSRKKKAENYLKKHFYRHFLLEDPPIYFVNHHLCHLASAYYTSGFDESLLIAWDAGGDLQSTMIGIGRGQEIKILKTISFAQLSLGAFYQIFQRHINLSDEGSLMGLASYGRPSGDLDHFVDLKKLEIHWEYLSRPVYYFGEMLMNQLGNPRLLNEPISERHVQVAADVQDLLERIAFRILEDARSETGMRKLCLSGGVALNATMNGKIARSGLFDKIYVHPNAGDGGCALGSAYIAYIRKGGRIENKRLPNVYWGREFSNDECKKVLDAVGAEYTYYSDEQIPEVVSQLLERKKVLAWFRGRAEWGPRALGSRSILADPREGNMQDRVNDIIKFRDEWRPFAPSMIEEAADDYLEDSFYSPFMLYTFNVKEGKKNQIPAVVHKDGTTRPQMVRSEVNRIYYETIKLFGDKTGVPVLLNTSFNVKGEPIVDSPIDAIKCFFGTGIDALLLNNFLLMKKTASGTKTDANRYIKS